MVLFICGLIGDILVFFVEDGGVVLGDCIVGILSLFGGVMIYFI